jgi:nucleoporin NDC1
MAFWELAMISSDFESRRVTIFQQLDRSGGATWTQILTICLAELQGIQDRIKDFHIRSQPPPAAAKPSDPAPTADATPAPDVRKPSAASVYPQPPPPTLRQLVRHRVSEMVIEHGSQPGAASPAAQLLAASAQGAATLLLTDAQREALAPGALRDRAAAAGTAVLATQVAAPLRKPWARRVAGVVCGAPRARGAVIAAAAGALAGLVVRSLKEDGAGRVQRDIPNIARTLAATLTAVEAFLATCPPHWSDVTFRGTAAERAGPEEVRAVVAALRGGLAEIVGAFGEYFDAMDVKADEARAWKKMVASKPAEKGPARPRTPEMRRAKN